MDVHACVSFLLVKDGRILLEKRSAQKEMDPGLVAIPGGHMEPGETRVQTLVREMWEELRVVPLDYSPICSLYHPTAELQLIHYYLVPAWRGDCIAVEAEELFWYSLVDAPLDIAADRVALSECLRLKDSGILTF